MRSDLVIKLIRAAAAGNRAELERVSLEAASEERKKGHGVLADRMERAFKNTPPPRVNGVASPVAPAVIHAARPAIVEKKPVVNLNSLLLPASVVMQVKNLVEEQVRAGVLLQRNIEPRHRVLLAGPPGNGKTSLAEAIANELDVPLWIVRYESLIGSYLGETAARLKSVIDYAKTTHCVLFFDEFDAIAKERGDKHETGEIKRVVNSLLMQVDDLPYYTVVIAASNHPELLDRAVWRRFQMKMELPNPSRDLLENFIERQLSELGELGYQCSTIAKKLYPTNFAEAEQFCLTIKRRYYLAHELGDLKKIIQQEMQYWGVQYSPKDVEA
jgi:SpoVK/Ycf46/Vps4 family AAA+-type ATPase